MKMRLLKTGVCKGAFNMAVDEALLLSLQRGESLPTLRFYRWNPPCLSVGYFQDGQKEVDFDGLLRMGFSMVRRITGGKAVLHDDEVTYSVTIPESYAPGSVLETYRQICRGIVRGLCLLGVKCEMVALERGTRAPQGFGKAACFSAPSWYEVVASGRKIVGSAQARRNGVILQHGSIPLTFSPKRVAACFKASSEEARGKLEAILAQKASSLSDVLGRRVEPWDVEEALRLGFERELGWEFVEDGMTYRELLESCRLSAEKYGTPRWNLERGRIEEDEEEDMTPGDSAAASRPARPSE